MTASSTPRNGGKWRAPEEKSTAATRPSEHIEQLASEDIVCGVDNIETPAPSKVYQFEASAGKKLQLESPKVESRGSRRIRTRQSG
ncbi:hypothetical protein ColLi_06356 [Colletotrichum liriopes]|uniref:Uncharacterized protein n=1 Tax=Colletotrichum liriopes TaxID=708192 RepID=A0AA37LTL7_9PEZI|nr:hypothetical protein ColLi_06356 [Colletotrichum liriopes]